MEVSRIRRHNGAACSAELIVVYHIRMLPGDNRVVQKTVWANNTPETDMGRAPLQIQV